MQGCIIFCCIKTTTCLRVFTRKYYNNPRREKRRDDLAIYKYRIHLRRMSDPFFDAFNLTNEHLIRNGYSKWKINLIATKDDENYSVKMVNYSDGTNQFEIREYSDNVNLRKYVRRTNEFSELAFNITDVQQLLNRGFPPLDEALRMKESAQLWAAIDKISAVMQ